MSQTGARAEPMLVQSLLDMGFSEVRAAKACILTHNCGLEPAINYLMDHAGDADMDIPLELLQQERRASDVAVTSGEPSAGDPVMGVPSDAPLVVHPDGRQAHGAVVGVHGETKVVLCTARELGMSAGKIGAQCAHAAFGLYRQLSARQVPWLRAWEDAGEKTVVLGVDTCAQLLAIAEAAEAQMLHPYMVGYHFPALDACKVQDAGRTEVAPGSVTVVGLGGVSQAVDTVTGHLRPL